MSRIFVRLVLPIVLVILLSPALILFTGQTEAVVLTDYDIEVDSAVVHVYYMGGNSGALTLSLINRCLHQLSITVITEGDGINTSPGESTIVLGAGIGTTRDIPVTVALPYESPAGNYQVSISTQITRVDGVFVENEKERHATVVALVHRHHEVDILTDHLQAVRGTVTKGSVLMQNIGNAVDFFSVENVTFGGMTLIPAVDHMRAERNQTVEFPVLLIHSTNGGGPNSGAMEVEVTSLCDDEFSMGRSITFEVVDDEDELSTASMVPGIGGMFLLLFLMLLFAACVSTMIPKFSRSHGTCTKTANHNIGTSRTVMVAFLIIMTSFMISSPITLTGDADGQVVPEVRVTMGSPPRIDISPLLPDESKVDEFILSYSDGEPEEHVVRITIDGPGYMFAFVKEQRVPGNGTVSFPVTIAHMGWYPYAMSSCSTFIDLIERQGVPSSGTNAQAGFIIHGGYYSLPFISIHRSVLDADDGHEQSTMIEVTNQATMNDGFQPVVQENVSLESQGFAFSLVSDRFHLDRNDTAVHPLSVTIPGSLPADIVVIRLQVEGRITGNNSAIGGATLVVIDTSGDDDGQNLWEEHGYFLFIPPLIIFAVLLLVLFVRRRRDPSSDIS